MTEDTLPIVTHAEPPSTEDFGFEQSLLDLDTFLFDTDASELAERIEDYAVARYNWYNERGHWGPNHDRSAAIHRIQQQYAVKLLTRFLLDSYNDY